MARIPLAFDTLSGKLLKPEYAEARASIGRYCCLDPKCRSPLVVVDSKYGRRFFRHQKHTGHEDCLLFTKKPNDGRHEGAISLLAVYLEAVLSRKTPAPRLIFETPFERHEAVPLPIGDQVVTEWRCPVSGRRPDLAILFRGEPVLLIEVLHTHRVDEFKAKDLAPYWWLEVNAKDIWDDCTCWWVTQFGNLPVDFEGGGRQGKLFG